MPSEAEAGIRMSYSAVQAEKLETPEEADKPAESPEPDGRQAAAPGAA
jgi:hypothetical protein